METCSVLFKSSQMETMVWQNLGPCLAKTTGQSRVLPGVFGEKIRANVKSCNSQYYSINLPLNIVLNNELISPV